MASTSTSPLVLLSASLFLLLALVLRCTDAQLMRLTVMNQCEFPVWPAIQANKGFHEFRGGGFKLESGDILSFLALTPGWSGRMWARTGCGSFGDDPYIACATGDCGPNLACGGAGGERPFTLAQLAVDRSNYQVTFDVNVVDGFNVPMVVAPIGGRGACPVAGCHMDLTASACPREHKFFAPQGGGRAVGCRYLCADGGGPCEAATEVKRRCPNLVAYRGDQPRDRTSCALPREIQIVFCPGRLMKQLVSS